MGAAWDPCCIRLGWTLAIDAHNLEVRKWWRIKAAAAIDAAMAMCEAMVIDGAMAMGMDAAMAIIVAVAIDAAMVNRWSHGYGQGRGDGQSPGNGCWRCHW